MKKGLTFPGTGSILTKSVAGNASDGYGVLAQLGEHLPYKQRVTGSSPVGPIECIIYQKMYIISIWANSRVAKGDRL